MHKNYEPIYASLPKGGWDGIKLCHIRKRFEKFV